MVRDPRARYHTAAPEPERFPAERVLRDLRHASSGDAAARIVTRYLALRAWHLGRAGAEPALLDHARAAAAAHLATAPASCEETALLRRLLPDEPPPAPWQALSDVSTAAQAAGHPHGALAARRAAWAAAMGAARQDVAARLAGEMADLFAGRGAGRAARRWARIARMLARAAPPAAPPPDPA